MGSRWVWLGALCLISDLLHFVTKSLVRLLILFLASLVTAAMPPILTVTISGCGWVLWLSAHFFSVQCVWSVIHLLNCIGSKRTSFGFHSLLFRLFISLAIDSVLAHFQALFHFIKFFKEAVDILRETLLFIRYVFEERGGLAVSPGLSLRLIWLRWWLVRILLLCVIVNLELDVVFKVVILARVLIAILLKRDHSLRQIVLLIFGCRRHDLFRKVIDGCTAGVTSRCHIIFDLFLLHGDLNEFAELLFSLAGHFMVSTATVSLATWRIILLH